jgi:hypothetical protein
MIGMVSGVLEVAAEVAVAALALVFRALFDDCTLELSEGAGVTFSENRFCCCCWFILTI